MSEVSSVEPTSTLPPRDDAADTLRDSAQPSEQDVELAVPADADKAESRAGSVPAPTEPIEPAMAEEDPVEKKRKQEQLRQESRKRGNRMFGMMLGTLKRAKQQVDTSVETDAMKKRLELEKKLKDKLDGEKRVIELRSETERQVKDLKMGIQKREEEISSADALYRVRHDAKYNLAGFLCTSFPLPPPVATTDAISVPFNPRLPHAMNLSTPTTSASRPIYYLPYRLLPSQEDRIEDQIDLVKKSTKRDQDEWRDLKLAKQKEVRRMRDELEQKLGEVSRLEREDRQRKRREAEAREETDKRERDKRRRTDRDDRQDTTMRDETSPTDTRATAQPDAVMETESTDVPVVEKEKETAASAEERAAEEGTDREEQAARDGPVGGLESAEDGKDVAATGEIAGDDDLEY
ncbi:pinin family protein [Sporobolomyces koalae]|uniref:pinin family protein n=1 Tax=Sporobolomyces koalae TaxID=500713 RepID=UPI00317A8943